MAHFRSSGISEFQNSRIPEFRILEFGNHLPNLMAKCLPMFALESHYTYIFSSAQPRGSQLCLQEEDDAEKQRAKLAHFLSQRRHVLAVRCGAQLGSHELAGQR